VKRLDVTSVRPHHDYVLVGRRSALTRDFATMLDDLRSALHRLDRQPAKKTVSSKDNGFQLPSEPGGASRKSN
jgi:ribonuclease P protein component